MNVGIGVVESDEDFVDSRLAAVFSDVPVWSMDSLREISKKCEASVLPTACLVADDKVVWRGHPSDAFGVVDAHVRGQLEAYLRSNEENRAKVNSLLESASFTTEIIQAIVRASHDEPDLQNSIAWRLVGHGESSEDQLKLAIAPATDAVRTDGGTNFATLDTLAVALHKSGRKRDAAHIAARVISVCDLVGNDRCDEVSSRAVRYVADAIETH